MQKWYLSTVRMDSSLLDNKTPLPSICDRCYAQRWCYPARGFGSGCVRAALQAAGMVAGRRLLATAKCGGRSPHGLHYSYLWPAPEGLNPILEVYYPRVLKHRIVKPRFQDTGFVCDIVASCLTLLCHEWYIAKKPTNQWYYDCRGTNLFWKCFSAENPDVTMAIDYRHFRSTSGSSAMCGPTLRPLEESSSHEWSMTECRWANNFNLYDMFRPCAMGRIVIACYLWEDKNSHWIPYILII